MRKKRPQQKAHDPQNEPIETRAPSAFRPGADEPEEGTHLERESSKRKVNLAQRNAELLREIVELRESQLSTQRELFQARRHETENRQLLIAFKEALHQTDVLQASEKVFESCREHLGAEARCIAIFIPEKGSVDIRLVDEHGNQQKARLATSGLVRDLCDKAIKDKTVAYANDLCPGSISSSEHQETADVHSILMAPLLTEDRLVGLFGLANKPGGFNADDARIAFAFGELAAIAQTKKLTLQALEVSRAHFRSVVTNASDAIVSYNANGRIVLWDRNAERIFGYTESEIRDQPIRSIVASRFAVLLEAGPAGANPPGLAASVDEPIEVVGLHKKGTTCALEISLATWESMDETFYTAIARDISRRKQVEHELNEKQRLNLRLLDSIPYPALLIGIDQVILAANTRSQVLGATVGDRCDTGESQLWNCAAPSAGRNLSCDQCLLKQCTGEDTLSHHDATVEGQTFDTRRIRLDDNLCLHYAIDVTAQRANEKALVTARREAEAASEAKSAFLANMSHEVRTPMNGMIGMIELALNTELSPEQRELLEMAGVSATNLLVLLDDVLDFSKIEAGKLAFDSIRFRFRSSHETALDTMALSAKQRGVALACNIHPDVPDSLVGDPARLRQVVINLISNAIKFTDSGEVVVEVDANPLAADQTELHFTVSDTGVGIPQDKLQVIFSPFSQADASTTRRYGGSGLGLAISRRLVGMMGGRIWVESEVGRGSRFHFTARFGVVSSPAGDSPRSEIDGLHGLSVLVVDHQPISRRLLERLLHCWKMRPTVSDSGPAAFKLIDEAEARQAPFSAALVEINMPGTSGFDIARRIKESRFGSQTSIIMLSSAGSPGDAARCRQIGAAGFLTRPAKQVDLLDAIRQATEPLAAGTPLITKHTLRESRRRPKVLVIEDHPINQALVKTMLEKRGYQVYVACDGEEGVDAYREFSFDLVLMDVQMPGMDGLQATTKIRAIEGSSARHTPIIAMTAHAMKGDRERFLETGMDAYVAKPITGTALFDAIDAVMALTPEDQKEEESR